MVDSRQPDFMSRAELAYNEGLEVINDVASWQTIKTGANSYASKRLTPSGLAIFKFEGFIDRPVEPVMRYFVDNYAEMSREFCPDMFGSQTTIKQFDETSRLVHELTKSPVPVVTPRDVVYFNILLTLDEGTFVIVDVSVDAEEVPPLQNYVRVDLKFCLHIFEQTPGDSRKTHLTHVALGDPRGSIPASFVNLSLSSRANFYEKVLQRMASALS